MSTGDISSARSLYSGNDREVLEDNLQTGTASTNAVVSQEPTNFTTGDSHSSVVFRNRL